MSGSPIAAIAARISSIESRFAPVTTPSTAGAPIGAGAPPSGAFGEVMEAATAATAPVTGPLTHAVPWSRLPGHHPTLARPQAASWSVGGLSTASRDVTPVGSSHAETLELLDDRPVAAGIPYAEHFDRAGRTHGVPPRLLASIGWVESRYDPTALSPDGAQGVMQLMPFISEAFGVDPHVPSQAIDAAARLLVEHRDRFGTWELAVASYFSGGGAVSRAGNTPPTPRSHQYVRSVTERLPHT
ncbi:transglycosylase SLT domain-containing protein [Ilumatobacter sp.]|uniref:transglycosylase SLT domain-containing protein n=1 Tax=Ilumatobacter sp. TaxID=1967498 RepID=UPI003B520FF3